MSQSNRNVKPTTRSKVEYNQPRDSRDSHVIPKDKKNTLHTKTNIILLHLESKMYNCNISNPNLECYRFEAMYSLCLFNISRRQQRPILQRYHLLFLTFFYSSIAKAIFAPCNKKYRHDLLGRKCLLLQFYNQNPKRYFYSCIVHSVFRMENFQQFPSVFRHCLSINFDRQMT